MFFPGTHGDQIELDPQFEFEDLEQTGSSVRDNSKTSTLKYINKSTIIMCNPNALIYQWMVTSANAYWLDFFLRRDCNVLIWNYRGYGASQ